MKTLALIHLVIYLPMFRFMKTFAFCWVMPMGRGHSIHQKLEVVLGPTSSWAPMPHLILGPNAPP
jgi:hypothetical protein